VSTFIVPKLRESVQNSLDNARKGNETSNYELEFRTKTRRDAEYNIVGVAQDVTEAAKHYRADASMARELRQLVDTANVAIFGINVKGNVSDYWILSML
jgi:hypothetical protein